MLVYSHEKLVIKQPTLCEHYGSPRLSTNAFNMAK